MTNVKTIKSQKSTSTTPARQAQIAERLAQIPTKCRRTYERAVNGSKAAAIKAQCLECCGCDRGSRHLPC